MRRLRSAQHSCLAILLTCLFLSPAFAQYTAALSDEQVKERLSYIEKALDSAQPAAKRWWYGWIGGYSAAAVLQGVLARAHWNDVKQEGDAANPKTVRDRGFAEDMLVGGLTCALGAGGLLISHFTPASGGKPLKLMSEATPEESRVKLLEAEELLRRCAVREKEGRGWLTHILNIGVNAAAGIVTVAAFDRPWSDGLLTFAAGEAVSLLNIFTQPRRAMRDWENYRAGNFEKLLADSSRSGGRKWSFHVSPAGISLGFQF